jgi:hypothetical protein
MKNVLLVSILFASAALSGCAHGPKIRDVRSNIPSLHAGYGRIYFYRNSFFGGAVQPDVKLNGTVIGEAKNGAAYWHDAKPGHYKVETTTEVTNDVEFDLAAGETKYIRFDVSMGFFVGHVSPALVPAHEAENAMADLSLEDPKGLVRMPASATAHAQNK